VMFSGAAFFRDGSRLWSMDHDGQEGISHLVIAGDLPAEMSPPSLWRCKPPRARKTPTTPRWTTSSTFR
jgi:hypothetical protein